MSLVTSPSRTVFFLVVVLILVSLACNAPGLGGVSEEEPVPETESTESIQEPPATPDEEADVEEPAEPPQPEEQPAESSAGEAVSEPVAEPAGQPVAEIGLSLANPHPFGDAVNTPNWDFEVLEVLRGDMAYQRILQDDPGAQPPPPGMEYVIAQVRLRNNYMDEYSHTVGIGEVFLVGDGRLTRTDSLWDVPSPELIYTDTYADEDLEAWLDALVPPSEGNLILFWDPSSGEEDSRRFLAIEEGASLPLPAELANIAPNDLGLDPQNPAPMGTTAVTEDWEITVLDVLRGDEAMDLLVQVSDQNTGADEGMDLILVKVQARYIGESDDVQQIGNSELVAAHDGNQVYEGPRYYFWNAYDPPWMQIGFLPGGQHEGWMALQSPTGETGVVLRFQPNNLTDPSNENNVRYLALE